MSGRHLGKAAHASRSLLSRMRDRIKHGVQAPPLWYETVRRSPPMTIPDKSKAELKKIVLPTDRLAQEYLHRNPDVAFEGVPMDGEPSATPLLFAQRQWELMKGGVPEAQAYRQVEGELAREKERAFDDLRELTRAATETMGARPALFADGDTIRQYSEWQERLDELPYVEWDFGEQVYPAIRQSGVSRAGGRRHRARAPAVAPYRANRVVASRIGGAVVARALPSESAASPPRARHNAWSGLGLIATALVPGRASVVPARSPIPPHPRAGVSLVVRCDADAAQVALDHWLVESLLAWTWRHEKLIVEREFDAEARAVVIVLVVLVVVVALVALVALVARVALVALVAVLWFMIGTIDARRSGRRM